VYGDGVLGAEDLAAIDFNGQVELKIDINDVEPEAPQPSLGIEISQFEADMELEELKVTEVNKKLRDEAFEEIARNVELITQGTALPATQIEEEVAQTVAKGKPRKN